MADVSRIGVIPPILGPGDRAVFQPAARRQIEALVLARTSRGYLVRAAGSTEIMDYHTAIRALGAQH